MLVKHPDALSSVANGPIIQSLIHHHPFHGVFVLFAHIAGK